MILQQTAAARGIFSGQLAHASAAVAHISCTRTEEKLRTIEKDRRKAIQLYLPPEEGAGMLGFHGGTFFSICKINWRSSEYILQRSRPAD